MPDDDSLLAQGTVDFRNEERLHVMRAGETWTRKATYDGEGNLVSAMPWQRSEGEGGFLGEFPDVTVPGWVRQWGCSQCGRIFWTSDPPERCPFCDGSRPRDPVLEQEC
jgi:rubrerythrin